MSRVEQAGLGNIFLCTQGGSRYIFLQLYMNYFCHPLSQLAMCGVTFCFMIGVQACSHPEWVVTSLLVHQINILKKDIYAKLCFIRYGNNGCRRTYLSSRDLQAHVAHRHNESKGREGKEKMEVRNPLAGFPHIYHQLLKTIYKQASARRALPAWWLQSTPLTTRIRPLAVTAHQVEVMVEDPLGLQAARKE